MNERDTRLRQFFAGYFNQDWDANGATSWIDVVCQYVKENPRTQVVTIRDDLLSWLDDPTAGPNLPAAFGCDYDPQSDGLDEREWVRQLVDAMERLATN
jgi:hypothetical protein